MGKKSLSSSEIGVLWITYQQKTMILQMLQYFISKSDDETSKQIMMDLYEDIKEVPNQLVELLFNEGIDKPVGFTHEDVHTEVPKLFDNGFDIMFVRLSNQISMGMHTLNLSMSYRDDITKLMRDLTNISQKYYDRTTQYLLSEALLPTAPIVSPSKSPVFVKSITYLGGLTPMTKKRALNTVEIAHIYHAYESNMIGLQMIKGFAQVAEEKKVSKYLTEGTELAKGIIKDLSALLVKEGLQAPGIAGGNVTASTIPPFSDKMMMYCVSMFCSFSLGGNSFGTSFSLRNDLPKTLSFMMKDIFEYAHQGAKIMIQQEWMEQPPQVYSKKN